MAQIVHSMALLGIEGQQVDVEVDLPRRLPATIIVGLPGNAIRESAHRVRSAITASGRTYPKKRVVVNLAPADLPKVGTAFDLPIAIGILVADEQVADHKVDESVFVGELSLDGKLRAINGALAIALAAVKTGAKRIILPAACAGEAAVVDGIEVLAADDLFEIIQWLEDRQDLPLAEAPEPTPTKSHLDLREVRGQHRARRALEIAAAGGHNLLLIGAPGCGKTIPPGAQTASRPSHGSTSQGPWQGKCPQCGGVAVFRSDEGRLIGACCAGAKARCWWTTDNEPSPTKVPIP